jgi:hypothetical protein
MPAFDERLLKTTSLEASRYARNAVVPQSRATVVGRDEGLVGSVIFMIFSSFELLRSKRLIAPTEFWRDCSVMLRNHAFKVCGSIVTA